MSSGSGPARLRGVRHRGRQEGSPLMPPGRAPVQRQLFCRSPWWRWAGCGSTRGGACGTARFPHGGVGPQPALPPSKPGEVVVAQNDDLPAGEVFAGRLPATEDVAPTAEIPGAHDRVTWRDGLPPAVPGCPVHRADGRERTLRVPANPLVVEMEVRPDPQPGPVGRHRQLCAAPVHGLPGHQGEIPVSRHPNLGDTQRRTVRDRQRLRPVRLQDGDSRNRDLPRDRRRHGVLGC